VTRTYVEERNGGLYVPGTRISVDSIVQSFNDGLSREEILGEFESLDLTQVYGVITYYLENQPSVDAYRLRLELRAGRGWSQRFEVTRQAAEPLPEDLRERLNAAKEQLRSPHSD